MCKTEGEQNGKKAAADVVAAVNGSNGKHSDAKQVPQPPYIKIGQRVVDVSAFKHPGGNIIQFFHGMDGSAAFEAFHGHSLKATGVLARLPEIEAPKECPMNTQPKEHTEEFVRLCKKWRAQGKFNPCYLETSLYGAATVLAIVLSWFLAPNHPIIGGILVGVAWAHCGFLQHMGGHYEMGSTSMFWQHFFEGLMKGGSSAWWRNRHNKHHAKTNVIGEDGDLRTTPFFAWDPTLAKKVPDWSLHTQAFTFLPTLGMYVFLFVFTVRKFVIVKKYWVELAMIVAHYALFVAALRWMQCSLGAAIVYYSTGYALQGIYLGFFFSLSHFAVERLPTSATWLESTMMGTVDWAGESAFWGYASGFLNVQIEHHMAPQMPMEALRTIRADTKALAQKLGLPYREFTFLEATKMMLGGLYATGREELARRKSLVAAAAAVVQSAKAE